jgi:glucose/arabinose dehydrogenase
VKMEVIGTNLNFPTSVAVDDGGNLYIAESGLPFGGAPQGGIVSRIDRGGNRTPLMTGLRAPVNGLTWHDGWLLVSEGGNPGRISRFHVASRTWRSILDGLPGFGNYHTNMAVIGPDERVYFSQGAMTNSGVIGSDSYDLAWVREVSHRSDIPGYDVTLTGFNAETVDPRGANGAVARTGAFAPFGASTVAGQRIKGRVPCSSAVMRCDVEGKNLELFAWGLRNAYGLGFLADGRLLATDQGADNRGSRPVANCPDFLFTVRGGAWYGWPDFFGGRPATDPCFRNAAGVGPEFLLANHSELPPPEQPLLRFEVNSCAVKFALVPGHVPRYAGDLVVALFGDERPLTGPAGPRVGRRLVRVTLPDCSVHSVGDLRFNRPIDVAFDRSAPVAYVVDFGEFEIMADKNIATRAGSGCVWKMSPDFLEA